MLSHTQTLAAPRMAPAHLGVEHEDINLHAAFRCQAVEKFDIGEALTWEGEAASHVFEIMEGSVRVFRVIGDGRRAILGFLHAGDLIGVASRDDYTFGVEALVPTKIRRLPKKRFQAFVAESGLQDQLIDQISREAAFAFQHLVLLGRKTAEERVCSFLLEAAGSAVRPAGSEALVQLPMSRLDIADHLGLTIETVSRSISRLIRKGVVKPQGRHALTIPSLSALARLTGEDDHAQTGCRPASQQAVWPN